MGDCLHAVHTEGDEAARPDTEHTEGSTQDPGQGRALRLGAGGGERRERGEKRSEESLPGGDVLLTVGTGHVDRSVTEGWSLDVLDLGDHLGGGGHGDVLLLGVGWGHGSGRVVVSRRGTSLLWDLGVQSTSSHSLVVTWRSCWHLIKIQTFENRTKLDRLDCLDYQFDSSTEKPCITHRIAQYYYITKLTCCICSFSMGGADIAAGAVILTVRALNYRNVSSYRLMFSWRVVVVVPSLLA